MDEESSTADDDRKLDTHATMQASVSGGRDESDDDRVAIRPQTTTRAVDITGMRLEVDVKFLLTLESPMMPKQRS